MDKIKVGVIIGSNREGSFTKAIIDNMKNLFNEEFELNYIDIDKLPFYAEELDQNPPQAWNDFRNKMKEMEAVIIASPEYNRSMPAVIKNALDVGSRPFGESVFDKKPTVVVTVSPGASGGFGANHHIRQVLTFLNMPVMQQPEMYIGNVTNMLDDDLNVVGEDNIDFIKNNVKAIEAWFKKLNKNLI